GSSGNPSSSCSSGKDDKSQSNSKDDKAGNKSCGKNSDDKGSQDNQGSQGSGSHDSQVSDNSQGSGDQGSQGSGGDGGSHGDHGTDNSGGDSSSLVLSGNNPDPVNFSDDPSNGLSGDGDQLPPGSNDFPLTDPPNGGGPGDTNTTLTDPPTQVPEPFTLSLFAVGLGGAAMLRRRAGAKDNRPVA
ncbi:MAG TPA: PEP-CTERM sorting domain-containing protein, partial [Rhizomicrobium sp.]|nr:PEP-CTERM sorting domain-containing protein [Rhizomicrobium sp.]